MRIKSTYLPLNTRHFRLRRKRHRKWLRQIVRAFSKASQTSCRMTASYPSLGIDTPCGDRPRNLMGFSMARTKALFSLVFMSLWVAIRVTPWPRPFMPIADAMERGFGTEVDYGQISKTYSFVNVTANAQVRYSPAEVVKVEKTVVSGMPDVSRISTSHVEKQNHTLRMHCRRLTRLTNAFSRKFENFQAAVSLNFAYYNFCKTHKALRMTPAMAAGIATSHWTVEELLKLCGE